MDQRQLKFQNALTSCKLMIKKEKRKKKTKKKPTT